MNQFALTIMFLQTFSIKYSSLIYKTICQNDIHCTNLMRSLSTLPSPAGKGDHASGVMRSLLRKGRDGDTVLVPKVITSCVSICHYQQNPSFIPTISLLKGLIH